MGRERGNPEAWNVQRARAEKNNISAHAHKKRGQRNTKEGGMERPNVPKVAGSSHLFAQHSKI